MAQFTVVGTRGNPVVIDGPEGATQEQAQQAYNRYQRQNLEVRQTQQRLSAYDPEKMRARRVYEQMTPMERFGVGTAASALETWEGAKQLAGLTGPETEERLRLLKAREEAQVPGGDIAGGLGHLAGEIAQVAIPAGPLARAGTLPIAAELPISAVQQGIKAVQPGQDPVTTRMQNTAVGALGALVGRAPMGVTPTPEAQALLTQARAQNVPMRMTPGQQGGGVWGDIEQFMEKTPLLGYAIRQQRNVGLDDWNRLVLNQVAPKGRIDEIGPEGFSRLKAQFTEGYNEVFATAPERLRPTQAWADTTRDAITNRVRVMSTEQGEELTRRANDLISRAEAGDIPSAQLKTEKGRFDDLRQAAINRGDIELADGYRDLSDSASMLLSLNITPEARAQLFDLDSRYGDLLTLGRAHGYKGAVSNRKITPEILLGAIRAEDPSTRKMGFARGSQRMQDAWRTADESLGRAIPAVGPGTGESVLHGMLGGSLLLDPTGVGIPLTGGLGAAAGSTYALAPMMRGQMPAQRVLREQLYPMMTPGSVSQIGEIPVEYGAGLLME